MSGGDMCANTTCHDIAAPGRDYCNACWKDELRGREVTRRLAVILTAEHEATVIADDEVAA